MDEVEGVSIDQVPERTCTAPSASVKGRPFFPYASARIDRRLRLTIPLHYEIYPLAVIGTGFRSPGTRPEATKSPDPAALALLETASGTGVNETRPLLANGRWARPWERLGCSIETL